MVIIKLALSHRDCAEITSLSGDTIIPMWMKGVFFVLQRQFDSVKAAQEIEQGIFSQAYIAIFGEYTTQSLLLPLLNALHRLFQGSCDILSFGQFEQPGIACLFWQKDGIPRSIHIWFRAALAGCKNFLDLLIRLFKDLVGELEEKQSQRGFCILMCTQKRIRTQRGHLPEPFFDLDNARRHGN